MNIKRGRPRAFDRDDLLRKAMRIFWEHGYEATSVNLLTSELAITPSSLYAAFGDKESLFFEAIEYYQTHHQAFVIQNLTADVSARSAIAGLLHAAVELFTAPEHPHGCLIVSSTLATTTSGEPVRQRVAAVRASSARAIEDRIRAGATAGEDLGGRTPETLATLAVTLFHGLSNQARDGVTREALHEVTDLGLAAWPEKATP